MCVYTLLRAFIEIFATLLYFGTVELLILTYMLYNQAFESICNM